MNDDGERSRLEAEVRAMNEPINKWWRAIRPYWHIATFLITMTAIATLNWSKIVQYDSRIIALELWRIESTAAQNQQSQNLAVVKQQVEDIHEYLMPKAAGR